MGGMASKKNRTPQTLLEAIGHFADRDLATEFIAKLRWPDGFVCPACGHKD
jgi:Transposase zinc-ribbon domain